MRYLFVGVLFVTSWCRAQNVTGDVRGRVQTADGAPVENANIRIDGLTVPMERATTTHPNGGFVFLGLPVGDFTLTITHVSYREMVVSPVRVTLGGSTNLGSATLEPGQTTLDTLVVSGGRITYNSEFSAKLSKSTMDNLPVDRDYKNSITLLPQVNTSYFGDGLSINGSTGAENLFFLNGVNITDNYASGYAPTLNNTSIIPYNFIREVSVKESGYSAEYGRAIGGIVDVVTQSGTNDFKGQAFSYFSGSFLNAEPKEGATGATIGKTSNYDLGVSLGGPIIKDRLWFFAAYSYFENILETKIAGGFYPDKTVAHLGSLKIDWKASKKTSVDLTAVVDPTERTPVVTLDGTLGIYVPAVVENPDAMWARTENGGLSLALSARTQLSNRTLLEYGFSGYRKKAVFGGATTYGDTTRQYYDLQTQAVSGGIGFKEDYRITKDNLRFKVVHSEQDHTIRAGVEMEYNTLVGPSMTPPGGNIFKEDVPSESYTTFEFRNKNDQATLYQAAFYQHDWQVSNSVLLEMGIRWERQQLGNTSGLVYQTFDNQWQPRLAINWFLNEAATQKLTFSYGRVYQAVPLNLGFVYATADANTQIDAYSSDPRVAGTPKDATIVSVSGADMTRTKDEILQTLVSDQLALQYAHQVGNGPLLTARLLYKSSTDPLMVTFDSTFTKYIGNPGRGELSFINRAVHEYTAAELGLSGSMWKGRFNYNLYYVLSRNYGNYMGAWDQEARWYSPTSTTLLQTTPERAANQTGLMPSDRTHSLKANASYRFKSGLTAGMNFLLMTGTPLNELIKNYYNGYGYDLLSKRGTFDRLPMLWDLNFRLAYSKANFPLRLSMDIFHIGNPQAVVDQVQLKYTDVAGTNPNPAYGQAVRRQLPMALRFGLEYNF